MLIVTHYTSPAILQPIYYYKIYKILKMRNKTFSSGLEHTLKNKSKIQRNPAKELNNTPRKNQGGVCSRVKKNPKSVQKYTANDSDNSNENQEQNGDLQKVKIFCSNSIELPNDAKRSGVSQNRSEKIELYKILIYEAKTTPLDTFGNCVSIICFQFAAQ